MGQVDRRCDHVYPEGHARAGEQCGSRILPSGEDFCKQHLDPGTLARDRETARLRRLSEKQMAEPSDPAFFIEGWDALDRPARECAERFGVHTSTVYQWYSWIRFRDARQVLQTRDPADGLPGHWWDLTTDHIPALVSDFTAFRGRFFRTPRHRPFLTPGFQQRWTAAILRTLVTGGRQVILSPPRHGKTELLIHVSVWLICRFPDIRILWVGGNEGIAQRSVGAVAGHLAQNRELIETYAGPGGAFRPRAKAGLPWSKSEFTVATRSQVQKGRTMTAIGRGGTLLSLDADIIVADDIEDHGATAQPGSREQTRRWWTTDLESRKEEHTALFVIGSRVHPDDLAGHLVANEEYESITETAHDPVCQIPDDDPARYDEHTECMLFSEIRSFRWLMKQKRAATGAGIYSMVYLNLPTAEGIQTFTAEVIDPCRDPGHVVGRVPQPEPDPEGRGGIRLVAGLDPSGSGYQAAFLWAFQVRPRLRLWMVDIENREGGGIPAARDIIHRWHEKYRLAHWVIEENLYHGAIVGDEQIVAMSRDRGIRVEAWNTWSANKWDPRIGVTALQPLFAEGTIVLPYGDGPSQVKTDIYRAQLIYYDMTAPKNRNRTGHHNDLVMASWFPLEVIRRANSEVIAEMGVDYTPSFSGFTGSDWNTAPWGRPRTLRSG